MISDAQARLLVAVAERAGAVYASSLRGGRSMVELVTVCESAGAGDLSHHGRLVGVDRLIDIDPDLPALVPAGSARVSTMLALEQRGLLETSDEAIETQRVGVTFFVRPRVVTISRLDLTDAAWVELDRWRARRAGEPPPPLPPLEPADRELLEIAERARRHGFAVVPVSGAARARARRLGRGPYATRHYVSGATKSILPTGTALVEISPESADRPDPARRP